MKVLAIETSSTRGSVALLEDDRVLAQCDFAEDAKHGRDLLPCVDKVTGGNNAGIDLVAVSGGPGSFTGLRVGLAFAKIFCIESGIPLVSVSSLDVIAENVTDAASLCVIVDARLGHVYAAIYDAGHNKIFGDEIATPEAIAAKLAQDMLVTGDGLKRYRDLFAASARVLDDEKTWRPLAVNVGKLGRLKFLKNGSEDPRSIVPRYLGRPQAELKWEKFQNGRGPK